MGVYSKFLMSMFSNPASERSLRPRAVPHFAPRQSASEVVSRLSFWLPGKNMRFAVYYCIDEVWYLESCWIRADSGGEKHCIGLQTHGRQFVYPEKVRTLALYCNESV